MRPTQCADPFRKIGTEWDNTFSRNCLLEKKMGNRIRHYQLLDIDADSHPMIVKMEKQLGKSLLQVAKLKLAMTLKACKLPYDLELQYSDQGNKIYDVMEVGSFSLGYCSVYANDIHQDNKIAILAGPKHFNEITKKVARLYAAAYSDTQGKTKIMYMYQFGNRQSQLMNKLRDEIGKYTDTLGGVPVYKQNGML